MSILRKPDREKYLDNMFDNHKDELEKIKEQLLNIL